MFHITLQFHNYIRRLERNRNISKCPIPFQTSILQCLREFLNICLSLIDVGFLNVSCLNFTFN